MVKKLIPFIQPVYRIVYHLFSSVRVNLYSFRLRISLKSFGAHSRVLYANINEPQNVSIGHHVYINRSCYFSASGSKISIGNYVMIGPHATIIAQNHDIDRSDIPMILNYKYTSRDIIIEDDVWIGANVTILAGVTVKRGGVIGAGSVVTKDVEEFAIVGGIPAKKIRTRFSGSELKKAKKLNLDMFKNQQIDWLRWGVVKKHN